MCFPIATALNYSRKYNWHLETLCSKRKSGLGEDLEVSFHLLFLIEFAPLCKGTLLCDDLQFRIQGDMPYLKSLFAFETAAVLFKPGFDYAY